MKTFKYIIISIAILIGLLGLSFGLEYLNIVRIGIFKPMKENIEREVFENTQSYIEGKRQEITKYRLEYMKSDSAGKEAIKMVIVQSTANFDESKLNDNILESFVRQMKYN